MITRLAFPAVFALGLVAAGETNTTCDRGLEVDLRSGATLRMQIRSGDIDIVGTSAPKLRVACEMRDMDRAGEVRIAFKPALQGGDLEVHGGPNEHFHVRIEVPEKTNLYVRSPAGDMTVSRVAGDKDIELHAGDLKIDVGDPTDYARAEASVTAGDLHASVFGVHKGGLFRSFKKETSGGKYFLHAHLGAGDLSLR